MRGFLLVFLSMLMVMLPVTASQRDSRSNIDEIMELIRIAFPDQPKGVDGPPGVTGPPGTPFDTCADPCCVTGDQWNMTLLWAQCGKDYLVL